MFEDSVRQGCWRNGQIEVFHSIYFTCKEWAVKKLHEQEATPPHEEPAFLSHEIEDQTKRLDREIMYLLKKLRSHSPSPYSKTPINNTNSTKSNTTKVQQP